MSKGNPVWNHPVTIEGYVNKALDVIFHLNAYVKKQFGMDLAAIVSLESVILPLQQQGSQEYQLIQRRFIGSNSESQTSILLCFIMLFERSLTNHA